MVLDSVKKKVLETKPEKSNILYGGHPQKK